MNTHNSKLADVASALRKMEEGEYNYFNKTKKGVPSRKAVVRIVKTIQSIMFPDYFKLSDGAKRSDVELLDDLFVALTEQISLSLAFSKDDSTEQNAQELAYEIIALLPSIKDALIKDVQAIYEGDPAATAPEEIILSYPGFYAISIYRIAHELYIRKIPCIARLMTEFAHEKTGIDIHAGATIGEYFFIDHGTGIVIGETTTIGNHVKIYQGVTLGAKSFELDENGNPIKGIKRHPDIGNNCVIYANATILGGDTKIGDGAVIGGNVWLTSSVPAGKVVYYNAK